MPAGSGSSSGSFRLLDLPAELIVEIVLYAQAWWRQEAIPIHTQYVGVKRLSNVQHTIPWRTESCTRGCSPNDVPTCLSDPTTPIMVPVSPAHHMSQLGRALRDTLLNAGTAIWRVDNTFYKTIAERSGRRDAQETNGHLDAYNARTLVAVHVCACLVRALPSFYRSLEVVRLALPKYGPGESADTPTVEQTLLELHDPIKSPLRHFDLQLYCDYHTGSQFVRGILCNVIETTRCFDTTFFFYSNILTSLYVHQPSNRRTVFGRSFFTGLIECSPCLQDLTIDAANGRFILIREVLFPKLRFLRLVIPIEEGARFLKALTLPGTLDIHLELVVAWRRQCRHTAPQAHEARLERHGLDSQRLWRYACALAFPSHTKYIFQDPPTFNLPPAEIWEELRTAALDIRLDPLTLSTGIACRRFPEYVNVSFASSMSEMLHFSPPATSISHVRRSLAVRDACIDPAVRQDEFNAYLVKPVYDVVRHLTSTLIAARPNSSFTGHVGVQHLVIHRLSFLPAYSLGWSHILESFSAIESLVLLCPAHNHDTRFEDNMEGCLHDSHLEALAFYLNDGAFRGTMPCAGLVRIYLPNYVCPFGDIPGFEAQMRARFNSPRRLTEVSSAILVTVGAPDM